MTAVIVYAAVVMCLILWLRRRKPDTKPELDFIQAQEIIDRLAAESKQLRKIDDLLTTSQLDGDIRCIWNSAGEPEDYTFKIGDTAEQFETMAAAERERLRKQIADDIDNLCNVRYGITQTVTQTTEKCEPEEQGSEKFIIPDPAVKFPEDVWQN